jgi:hypothetical protein
MEGLNLVPIAFWHDGMPPALGEPEPPFEPPAMWLIVARRDSRARGGRS